MDTGHKKKREMVQRPPVGEERTKRLFPVRSVKTLSGRKILHGGLVEIFTPEGGIRVPSPCIPGIKKSGQCGTHEEETQKDLTDTQTFFYSRRGLLNGVHQWDLISLPKEAQ